MTANGQSKMPRLVLAGDVAITTSDPEEVMRRIAPYFSQSAIAMCNCEWPLADRGTPWPGKAGKMSRSSPSMVRAYTMCDFGVVSLANNHIMNFGAEGMMQTIEVLDQAGIAHCGGGADQEAAHRPAFVEWGGRRYAFLSYTSVFTPGHECSNDRPGLAVVKVETSYRIPKRLHEVPGLPMDMDMRASGKHLDRACDDIRKARAQADAVIVAWHWGVSMGYQHLVPYQVDFAHAAVDAGADIVFGHHPHVVQPIEIYKGKLIAYSLAQCGFDTESRTIANEAIVLEVALGEDGLGEVLVRPVVNALKAPEILDREAGRWTLDWLARLSMPYGTVFEPRGDAVAPVSASKVPSARQAQTA